MDGIIRLKGNIPSLASPRAGRFGLSLNLFFMLIYCDILYYNRLKLHHFLLNKLDMLKSFLDLGCGLSLRGDSGSRSQTTWEPVTWRVVRHVLSN